MVAPGNGEEKGACHEGGNQLTVPMVPSSTLTLFFLLSRLLLSRNSASSRPSEPPGVLLEWTHTRLRPGLHTPLSHAPTHLLWAATKVGWGVSCGGEAWLRVLSGGRLLGSHVVFLWVRFLGMLWVSARSDAGLCRVSWGDVNLGATRINACLYLTRRPC